MLLKRKLLSLLYVLKSYPKRSEWRGDQRIFCLSLQKTGTTSFGNFFEYFDYPVVRSDMAHLRGWNKYWFQEEYDSIFSDPVFKNYQVFEDAPFWAKDFYKILQQKFPNAKFVLITRNSDAWFDSMLAHGKGDILGDKRFHAKNYKRTDIVDNPDFNLSEHKIYYTQFYEKRNNEIINYFKRGKTPFLHISLEDALKWTKLADFMGLKLPENFEMHSNSKVEN